MSKLMKFFAAGALALTLVAYAPGGAEARWGGGWHGGWHGGTSFVIGVGPGFGYGWGFGPY